VDDQKDVFSSTTVEVYLENSAGFEEILNQLSTSNIDQYLSLEIENLVSPDQYTAKWNIFNDNGKNKLMIYFNFTEEMKDQTLMIKPMQLHWKMESGADKSAFSVTDDLIIGLVGGSPPLKAETIKNADEMG
jgi:hypothetical protein